MLESAAIFLEMEFLSRTFHLDLRMSCCLSNVFTYFPIKPQRIYKNQANVNLDALVKSSNESKPTVVYWRNCHNNDRKCKRSINERNQAFLSFCFIREFIQFFVPDHLFLLRIVFKYSSLKQSLEILCSIFKNE